jgi:hypothetical protein
VRVTVTSQCGQAERPPPGNPSLRNCRIGVNYLLRRVNPTPHTAHTVLMPPEMLLFGDDRITAAFQSRPPDYVVTAHKDAGEYGQRLFGRDYGRASIPGIRRATGRCASSVNGRSRTKVLGSW